MYRTFDKEVLPACVEHCAELMVSATWPSPGAHRPARSNPRSGKEIPMNRRVLAIVSTPNPPLETYGKQQLMNLQTALQELYLLLEDYAPLWYTQEHHDLALRALLQRDS
jgi:hypothetical protein